MIAAEDLPRYLEGHGLFDPECAIAGRLSIVPGIGRIGGLRLIRSPGDSYFIKQAPNERDRQMIRREAEVYHWLLGEPREKQPLIPHCYGFDSRNGALILELDPHAVSFHDYCRDQKGGEPAAAALAALSIARLHRLTWTLPLVSSAHQRSLAAWVLNLPELELGDYLSLSTGSLQCVRLLQGEERLCLRLRELANDWLVETPIHGDLRFSNMLYHPGGADSPVHAGRPRPAEAGQGAGCGSGGSPHPFAVSLIDWELARPGDPCWDVGSMLANYFTSWIQYNVPIGVVQAATQSFWLTYSRSMNFTIGDAQERLIRSMQYAATRLIQYVIEMTEDAASPSAHNVLMLQLADNILDRPEHSLHALCGLPIGS